MMKIDHMVKKALLIFFGTVCVIGVGVSSSSAAGGWYDNISIREVIAHGGYYLIGTNSTLADCGVQGRFTIPASTPMARDMYAMALTAYLSGKKIAIYVDANQGCAVSGMVSTLMTIHD
ncbi:MAG: hypothetical protein NDI77_12725 [Geobacteraceae bacterium]|nr:hypothetical protein [Geobacteraceae bacterium]